MPGAHNMDMDMDIDMGHGHRQNHMRLLRGITRPSLACYRPHPRLHGQGVMQRAGPQLRHVVPHLR